MGMDAVQAIVARDMLQRSERELAALRAAGSPDAERIGELERQIASSRRTLAWLADFMSAGSPLADGDDDEHCRAKPVITSATTTQTINRAGGIPRVTVRATGNHDTADDAMHGLGTLINIIDKRTNWPVMQDDDDASDNKVAGRDTRPIRAFRFSLIRTARTSGTCVRTVGVPTSPGASAEPPPGPRQLARLPVLRGLGGARTGHPKSPATLSH